MTDFLVADASSVIRKVARRILEDLGFTVREAEDAGHALDLCREAMPDMALIDWNMPGLAGIELIAAIRELPGGGSPRILFLASEADVAKIARAMRAGADDYMLKPFDRNSVEAKLREMGAL